MFKKINKSDKRTSEIKKNIKKKFYVISKF